jgi:hypothetical protein
MFKFPSDDIAGTTKERGDWHDTLTLDDSWFYDILDQELIWLRPDGKVPDRDHVTM